MKQIIYLIVLLLTLSFTGGPKRPKGNVPKSFKKAGRLKPKFNKATNKGIAKNKFNRSSRKPIKQKFNKVSRKGTAKNKFNKVAKRKELRQKFNKKSKRGYAKSNSKKNVRLNRLNKRARKFNLNSKRGYAVSRFNKSTVQKRKIKKGKAAKNKLSSNPKKLFKSAISKYKNSDLTHVGRAVTKHPEYFGFKSNNDLRKVYRTDAAINKLGSDRLKEFLRKGDKSVNPRGKGRYRSGWINYSLKDGSIATWSTNGKFIGFRGPESK